MYNLIKFNDIYNIAKSKQEFTINLSSLTIKERIRVIDFISGLTFKNGKIEKIDKDTFKCIYK